DPLAVGTEGHGDHRVVMLQDVAQTRSRRRVPQPGCARLHSGSHPQERAPIHISDLVRLAYSDVTFTRPENPAIGTVRHGPDGPRIRRLVNRVTGRGFPNMSGHSSVIELMECSVPVRVEQVGPA